MKKYTVLLLALALTLNTAAFMDFGTDRGKTAIIQLDGTINTGNGDIFSTSSITPEKVREFNSRAMERNADSIIYEWNSGGGTVVASKEIMRAIKSVDVPTVCRFRDIAASGAYLSSLGCDRIVADSASLTGSIGVKSSYLEFSGLLNELDVEYVNITAGKYKEVGSQYQNTSEEDIRILKEKADQVHKEFLYLVESERNLTEEDLEKIETGELLLGQEAEEANMVDELGGRRTAVIEAENLTNKELKTFKVESQKGFDFFSLLFSDSWVKQLTETGSPIKASWN